MMHRTLTFFRVALAFLFGALLLAGSPAFAQDEGDQSQQQQQSGPQQGQGRPAQMKPTVVKTFGGWDVRCYPVNSPAPCDMWEAIAFKKGGQLAVSVSIVYAPSQDRHVIQLILPLGVDLAKGANVIAGGYTSPTFKFHHCDRVGCYVAIQQEANSVVQAMSGVSEMKVRITQFHGKAIDLGVTLKGFGEAHAAMVDLAKQKTSGAKPAPAATP
jgi:invasion protein IalB